MDICNFKVACISLAERMQRVNESSNPPIEEVDAAIKMANSVLGETNLLLLNLKDLRQYY